MSDKPSTPQTPDYESTLLDVRLLNVSYDRPVLSAISLSLAAGEIVWLSGRNGSGKSTLLAAIAGHVPSSGAILMRGAILNGLGPAERARAGVAYLHQTKRLFGTLTVAEHFTLVESIAQPSGPDGFPLDDAFTRFPFLRRLSRIRGRDLSGGERALVAIAALLYRRPRLLLLDEPTPALAPDMRDLVLASIRDYCQSSLAGAVIAEHVSLLSAIEQERVAQLHEGRMRWTRAQPRASWES